MLKHQGISNYESAEKLVQRACDSLAKCNIEEVEEEVCSYNNDNGKFNLLPNKCSLLKLNCEKSGRK